MLHKVNSYLRLGSGTGLVGIALAAIWSANVVLTDLPGIEGNLLYNINANKDLIESMGGSATGKVLDWKDEERASRDFGKQKFEVGILLKSLQLRFNLTSEIGRGSSRSNVR